HGRPLRAAGDSGRMLACPAQQSPITHRHRHRHRHDPSPAPPPPPATRPNRPPPATCSRDAPRLTRAAARPAARVRLAHPGAPHTRLRARAGYVRDTGRPGRAGAATLRHGHARHRGARHRRARDSTRRPEDPVTDAADAALPALLTRTGRPAAELWPDSGLLHLNHGSYGRVPTAATDHQQRLQREMEAAPMRFMAAAPAGIAQARERIARFLRTDPDRLALVPNASAGVSTALRSLPLP